jgi:DNA-binding CsgD family transcriptional regulator
VQRTQGHEAPLTAVPRKLAACRGTFAEAAPDAGIVSGVDAPVRARQLPPDIVDFTGRVPEIAEIAAVAITPERLPGLVVVTGAGGTGKTALAVHAGHLLGDGFADAHLYADLHGHSGGPLCVPHILKRFIHALSHTGRIPEDQEELVALFRTTIAGRRCLVVLDDAVSEAHVRPLLPPGPDSLTIVTSRNWLGGLAGGTTLRLGPMSDKEGHDLLTRIVGEQRSAEPGTDELLALCGLLPLTIRIAAARLLSRPRLTVRELSEQLRDEGRRLSRLTAGDATINDVFATSYAALDEADQAFFRRLALLRGVDFGVSAVAVVTDTPHGEAQDALDRLTDRNMVATGARPGRYLLHTLARLFAQDMLARDERLSIAQESERRLTAWFLKRVNAAAHLVNPCVVRLPTSATADEPDDSDEAGSSGESGDEEPFADRAEALSWLDAERHNFPALVRRHRGIGDAAFCWTMSDALRGYYSARRYLREWAWVAGEGLAAAQSTGDTTALAAMHLNVGMVRFATDRHAEADEHYQQALELAVACGWRDGEAAAYRNLAATALVRGETDVFQKYLRIWEDINLALDFPTAPAPAAADQPSTAAPTRDREPVADAPATPGGWHTLSRREQTVGRLVVQGLTNQQIATRIRCSPETVKFHLRNIFRKLGIVSRIEIARFVLPEASTGLPMDAAGSAPSRGSAQAG